MSPDDSALAPSKDDDETTAADAPNAQDSTFRRRMFLRKMTAEAVVAGGRLAGSARLMRSAAAAGETLRRELEGRQVAPTEPGVSTQPPDAPSIQEVVASRSWRPWAPPLTPDQAALLASAVPAALATVQAGNAPQLTASPFHWDGGVFRISALDWSARTRNIEIDARVSLLIADPHGGLSLSATGRAAVIAGASAQDETLPILRKYALNESDVAARWADLNANGDRLVIVVVPERMLWRFDEPAWGSVSSSDARRS